MTAAEAIAHALSGNLNALERYTQVMQEELGSDTIWPQPLAQMFYRIPGIAYEIGVKQPRTTQRMAQIFTGQVRYSDVVTNAHKGLSAGIISG